MAGVVIGDKGVGVGMSTNSAARGAGARKQMSVIALAGAALALAACGSEPPLLGSATITTHGEATALATPDIAHINIGVSTEGDAAGAALAANAERMSEVFDAIEALGIDSSDTATTTVSLQPIYEAVPGPDGRRENQLVGYIASNTVRITLRDVGAVGEALDAVTAAGSNTVSGLSFDVSNPEALQDEARRDAFADARRKADLLAQEANVRLGDVISINEHGASVYGPAGPTARMMEASTPISPGQSEIRATVSVVWEID